MPTVLNDIRVEGTADLALRLGILVCLLKLSMLDYFSLLIDPLPQAFEVPQAGAAFAVAHG